MEQILEDGLALFFSNLSQLCFDKVTLMVCLLILRCDVGSYTCLLTPTSQHRINRQTIKDKEKESATHGPYKLLINQLQNLVAAERSYVNLGFVTTKNKIFMRKDNSVRAMYESVRSELSKVVEDTGAGEDIAAVASQTCRYITARIQLIDIYEKMYSLGVANKVAKYEELLTQLEHIMDIHSFGVTHIVLTSSKTAISLECEILMLLLRAQIDLQNWRFLSTLLDLHGASVRISAWEKILQNRESWKLGFLKVNALPPLVQWLVKFKAASLNKFSLYFHHILSLQTSPLEFKVITNKYGIDSFQRLQNLQKKYDAMTVMLLFDTNGASDFGHSYQHPNRPDTKPDPFVIMVYSPVKLLEQLPTITKAIVDKSSELSNMDRVVCCYSIKDQSSYFMTCIDPRVILVFVFDSKKDEKETSLTKNILEFSTQLRTNCQVFTKLKLNKQ